MLGSQVIVYFFMKKTKNLISIIKSWSLRRKIFFGVLILIVIFTLFKKFGPHENTSIVTGLVQSQNLSRTVLATGQVTSQTDLSLSFANNGVVRDIRVKVGDNVRKGQVLANLNQGVELAELSKARATLASANAKYQKLVEGSSDSEINLARVLLENAKNDYEKGKLSQDILVAEAENQYLSYANSSGTNLITIKNDYEYAIKTRDTTLASLQAVVNQRQAELDVKLAKARTADLDLARADIFSAEAGVQSASAKYEDTLLRAPANGTITSVDVKVGELAQAQKEVMILQDISNLYIEANINESNIALLKLGQDVDITYDSMGPDQKFKGTVFSVDPASTNDDGVVNYKIKVALNDKNEIIRPGMNANIVINIFNKQGVLVVPITAIYTDDTGSYVKRVTNMKSKKSEKVYVSKGEIGDGNLVEITSGLVAGENVVVVEKK